jgi:hypothetical protein
MNPNLFVEVELLKNPASLLAHTLKMARRCVTQQQMDAVTSVVPVQTPLMITMLAEAMKSWNSFTPPCAIPKSVREIIVDFFIRMEHTHGEKLTSHTVAYLTIPLQGVSEMELLDIFSIDDVVLSEAYPWYAKSFEQFDFSFKLSLTGTCFILIYHLGD